MTTMRWTIVEYLVMDVCDLKNKTHK